MADSFVRIGGSRRCGRGSGQRVADRAVLTEQLAPGLLGRGQLDSANLGAGPIVVADQDDGGQDDASRTLITRRPALL